VLIVHNGEDLRLKHILSTIMPEAHVITNSKPRAFGESCNQAAELANHEILMLLNSDLILSPLWLDPILEVFARESEVGTVGNLQHRIDTGWLDHGGKYFRTDGTPDHMDERFLPRYGQSAVDHFEVPAVTAACMGCRRSLFISAGGFDSAFQNGFEDDDFSMRLRAEHGKRHFVAARSRVFHAVSPSPNRKVREVAGRQLFLERWGEKGKELACEGPFTAQAQAAQWQPVKRSAIFTDRFAGLTPQIVE
jgi:GT2 family glycosyltransferase